MGKSGGISNPEVNNLACHTDKDKVEFLCIKDLYPFKHHPFYVNNDDALRRLAQSISERGVLTPIIVRRRAKGGYELISGHRRKAACEMIGIELIPAIIKELDDDSATIIMVDSNQQRERILPSEKAFAYKMKLAAIAHQGKASVQLEQNKATESKNTSVQLEQKRDSQSKITSVQLEQKLSRELVAEENGESQSQIQRYIRLTYLIPKLLKLVDNGTIALTPAVNLSYLSKELQKEVYDLCQVQDCSPSLSQAVKLKRQFQAGTLTTMDVVKIMSELKANQKDKISFRADTFAAYFPKGYTPEQMEKTIIAMLKDRQRKERE